MKRAGKKAETITRRGETGKLRQPHRHASLPRLPIHYTPAPPLFLSPRRPGLPQLCKYVLEECERDDIFGRAAQLAYYFLFSLFPMLLFLAALLAFLPIPNLLDSLLDYLSSVLPSEAFRLVSGTAIEVISHQRFGLLSLGLLITLWTSSSAMVAVIHTLNIAYNVPESRPWWRQRILAIALTVGLAIFTIIALTIIFFGGQIGERIALSFGYLSAFHIFWNIAQWPLLIGFVLFGLDLVYFFAPNMRMRWRWITPGAVFALVCWVTISYGLRYYIARFTNYDATYGSIGGVMILMLWLYLTGLLMLLGGEINSVIEQFVYGAHPAGIKPGIPANQSFNSRS